MADQFLACPGRPAAAVRNKLRENKERKQRAVEKFIVEDLEALSDFYIHKTCQHYPVSFGFR